MEATQIPKSTRHRVAESAAFHDNRVDIHEPHLPQAKTETLPAGTKDDGEPEALTAALFRTSLKGHNVGLREAFQVIRAADWPGERVIDTRHQLAGVRIPVSADITEGCWELCADGPIESPNLFLVVTRAHYSTLREEAVIPEGLFEIHLLLQGPAAVDRIVAGDEDPELQFHQPTLILCQAGADAGYSVCCPPGAHQLVSLYIEPKIFADLFGLTIDSLGPLARQLLQPTRAEATIAAAPLRLQLLDVARTLTDERPLDLRRLHLLRAKALEILYHIVDDLASIETAPVALTLTVRDIEMLNHARAILQQDVANPPTIPALSRAIGTNTDKLKRGFKMLFGVTVFEYGLHCRMTRAQQLLCSGLPVKTVAASVGYRHQASFATAFRNFFGYQPTIAKSGGLPDYRLHVDE